MVIWLWFCYLHRLVYWFGTSLGLEGFEWFLFRLSLTGSMLVGFGLLLDNRFGQVC